MSENVPSTTAAETGTERPLGVLVGFDGSKHARLALQYASAEATRRDAVLTVLSASVVPAALAAGLAAIGTPTETELAQGAADGLVRQARELLSDHPGEVVGRAELGDAIGLLAELSAQAQVVIVGARGHSGFVGRVLGSVATELPAHAQCPTIVVGEEAGDGDVTVAVDGSDASEGVLREAAAAAIARGTGLDVLDVLAPLDDFAAEYPGTFTEVDLLEIQRTEVTSRLDALVTRLAEEFPRLEIRSSVEVGLPRQVLSEHTASTQLMVMGTRGRGAVASALLGSVSRHVLHHARGPVMVVPA